MKLLLVATNRESSPFPVAPLGALCVAAAARKAGHTLQFLDLGLERSPQRTLRKALAADDHQAVAFSIRNLDNCFVLAPHGYAWEVGALADTVRQLFQGPLILGGSGFSVSPRGWMRRLPADYGVIGEGERVFVELLARLEAGQSLEGINGVVTKQSSETPLSCAASSPAEAIKQLGELTLPAHELCRYGSYLKRGGSVSVQTKRGCPFQCVYCIYPQLEGRRYRLRPPEAVADEVELVVKQYRSRHFFFVDSVFNDPRSHAMAVCAALERRRLPMRWMAFCNPVGFDAELAYAMARAGCEGLEFGLDAATPKMLAAMRKPFGQDEIKIAMKAAHDAKQPFAVHLLFGGPGETWPDVEEAQRFLSECAPANSVFASFGIRVYEDTAIAEIARREGAIPAEHDLFEPAYYVSPAMAERPAENLDRIARRIPEWTSPVDWQRPLMRYIQRVVNFLGVRPSVEGHPRLRAAHAKMNALNCDVLVVGGGAAGVAAAAAAGRAGAQVVLLEHYGFLGGLATAGAVGTVCGLYLRDTASSQPELVASGFLQEFSEQLAGVSGSAPKRLEQGLWVLPFQPWAFARVADGVLTETGNVTLVLHATAAEVSVEGRRISQVRALAWNELLTIHPRCVVDCTGEATAVSLAGEATEDGCADQSPALVFAMENVAAGLEDRGMIEVLRVLRRGVEQGHLPAGCERISLVPGHESSRRVAFKLSLLPGGPGESHWRHVTAAEREGRAKAEAIQRFLVTNAAAFKDARFAGAATQVGVRAGRRIQGRATLQDEDVLGCRKFTSGIARGCWPMEQWRGQPRPALSFLEECGCYEIPLDCLRPTGLDNVLVAGRCLSAAAGALASARVIGTALATGWAAGSAAAGCAGGKPMEDVVNAVRQQMAG